MGFCFALQPTSFLWVTWCPRLVLSTESDGGHTPDARECLHLTLGRKLSLFKGMWSPGSKHISPQHSEHNIPLSFIIHFYCGEICRQSVARLWVVGTSCPVRFADCCFLWLPWRFSPQCLQYHFDVSGVDWLFIHPAQHSVYTLYLRPI